jgi:hypothetical protein
MCFSAAVIPAQKADMSRSDVVPTRDKTIGTPFRFDMVTSYRIGFGGNLGNFSPGDWRNMHKSLTADNTQRPNESRARF